MEAETLLNVILLLACVVMGWLLIKKVFFTKDHTEIPESAEAKVPEIEERDFTLEELREFDGSDPAKPILVALNYNVYDVTRSKNMYGQGMFLLLKHARVHSTTNCIAYVYRWIVSHVYTCGVRVQVDCVTCVHVWCSCAGGLCHMCTRVVFVCRWTVSHVYTCGVHVQVDCVTCVHVWCLSAGGLYHMCTRVVFVCRWTVSHVYTCGVHVQVDCITCVHVWCLSAGGPYQMFAGRDASRAFATLNLSKDDLRDSWDDLSDLGKTEQATLKEWEEKYILKYRKIGALLKDRDKKND